jgi:hypothetical protein
MPGLIPSQGERWNGQTSEILHAHVYRNEGKRRCGLLLGLDVFRLVAHPLQSGVVGTYPVWGVWFPNQSSTLLTPCNTSFYSISTRWA